MCIPHRESNVPNLVAKAAQSAKLPSTLEPEHSMKKLTTNSALPDRIEPLDEDGRSSAGKIRGIRLLSREDTFFYASSLSWLAGKDMIRSSGDGYFLPLVRERGCTSGQAEVDCPKKLFDSENWKLISQEEWQRILPSLEASKWKYAAAIGLTADYLLWVRDKPATVLDMRTGEIRPATSSTTAGRVFCACRTLETTSNPISDIESHEVVDPKNFLRTYSGRLDYENSKDYIEVRRFIDRGSEIALDVVTTWGVSGRYEVDAVARRRGKAFTTDRIASKDQSGRSSSIYSTITMTIVEQTESGVLVSGTWSDPDVEYRFSGNLKLLSKDTVSK